MKKQYNHACDLAFEYVSNREDGEDVSRNELVAAILRRVADLITNKGCPSEIKEATMPPFDTYEYEDFIPGRKPRSGGGD